VTFATDHADRVVVLSDGKLLADGTPRAVFTDETVTAASGVRAPVPTRVGAALGVDGVVGVADLLARLR
jgi:ABC-type hemin transport system ATPase subunit